jgi:parvulin-like peptidyl-prolyl isomerase
MATKKIIKKSVKTTTAKPAAKATQTTVVKKTAPKKAVTKKTAPKTTTLKKTVAVAKPVLEKEEKQVVVTPQQLILRKPYVILVIAIILLGAALYYFRGLVVAAVVNGQPISRLEVLRQAEKQSGKQTLDTLVRDALIEQVAKQGNITVSDKEVNDEIAILQNNLKKQGQSIDQVLAAQGMTLNDLRKLIRLDKLVQKMVGKDVKVTDQEVATYIDQNKSSLPSTDEATLKKQVKAQLTQQKTNAAVQKWLADIQRQAKIVYFVQY